MKMPQDNASTMQEKKKSNPYSRYFDETVAPKEQHDNKGKRDSTTNPSASEVKAHDDEQENQRK